MSGELVNHYISKIEGHGRLKYSLKESLVQVEIDEGERLFEKLVLGQSYKELPFITARICGVCPTSHALASITAIENAFGVRVNDSTHSLRKALQAAQIVQSHALHLFFLALPDYLKVQNGLQLHEKNPRAFKIASKIKGTGDRIIEIVGGRAVHPVTPTVGGFLKTPAREEIEKLILEIKSTYPLALEAFDLFAGFRYPHLKRSTEYFSLAKDGSVDIFGDTIVSSQGVETPVSEYQYVITEKVRSYSSAKFAQHDGHGLMVGAIARLNLMEDGDLNPRAQKAVQAAGVKKAFTNSYQNNLAQAIEILHFLELAEKELTNFLWGKSERPKVGYQIKAGTGIGAVEAPRGTLYHAYEFNDKGVVTNCDIITPTVQNLTNLEDDANEYLKQNKMVNIPRKERELEMLVRAYDPCITCSVH
jgi:coenzyme F420-reducing hydrogenase alpha subunit